MEGSRVDVEYRGAVCEIGLQSGKLNLVNRELLRALNDALVEAGGRTDVRCLIMHGTGAKAFCAGSDIKEFAHLRHGASEQKILFEDMVLRTLARMPMPSIAAIDGPALGGGFELALACDLRVVRRGVAIGLPEATLGGLAANGALRLTRLVGPARAKELLFTAQTIVSEQALAWGLVNSIAEGSAIEAARDLARTICSRGPLSNRLAKQLVDMALDGPLDAALVQSTVSQQKIFDSEDLHEGVAAFLAKRSPAFSGR